MQVRSFSAPTLHEALALVRQGLGPDAVILDRGETLDAQGRKLWQVHAAIDRPAAPPPASEQRDPVLSSRLERNMARLESIVEGLGKRESEGLRSALGKPALQRAFDSLTEIGVAAPIAFEMAADFAERKPVGSRQLSWGTKLEPARRREAVLISGPEGAGKTALAAKIATHFTLQGISVALLSTDTHRIGGFEPLKAYAEILGLPCLALRQPADVRPALEQLRSAQLLLIDSEGWSARRHSRLRKQAQLWGVLPVTRRLLLLPANMDEADAVEQLAQAKEIEVTDLAFSKLDATARPGKVVNWAAASTLPLSFCSFGPEVTEQMGWLSPQALANLLHSQKMARRGK